ncbi:MAG TPA: glycosyltransferase [Prolixibacteraceae bacterium]|nr:glycosyltransferase [Prolixibacteraceae bacterium]
MGSLLEQYSHVVGNNAIDHLKQLTYPIKGMKILHVSSIKEGGGASDVHIPELPPDAHRAINALQRGSDIIVQKSLKEGFGLTVTEGLWKGKPVIAGDTGGIKLQVINHFCGFRVNTQEGAAMRIRYLLKHPEIMETMGKNAHQIVLDNFFITRHLKEYLTLVVALIFGPEEKIEFKRPAF